MELKRGERRMRMWKAINKVWEFGCQCFWLVVDAYILCTMGCYVGGSYKYIFLSIKNSLKWEESMIDPVYYGDRGKV